MARKPESPSLGMEEAGRDTRPDLVTWGGAPRRNRTGDPILTIDAPVVHDAMQHPRRHTTAQVGRRFQEWERGAA